MQSTALDSTLGISAAMLQMHALYAHFPEYVPLCPHVSSMEFHHRPNSNQPDFYLQYASFTKAYTKKDKILYSVQWPLYILRTGFHLNVRR